jgi:hypothetical protein
LPTQIRAARQVHEKTPRKNERLRIPSKTSRQQDHDEAWNFSSNIFDTDTTINSIRDTIIASYLGFDLVNIEKHGF